MLALPANPGCGPDTYQAAWNMHKWATQKLQQDRAWRCWAHICWPIGIHQRSPDNWQQFFMNDNAMAWQGRAWLLDHTYSNDIYIYINIYGYIYIYAAVSRVACPPPWYGSKTYVLATFSWNPPKHMVFTMFWQARPPKPWYLQRFVILHCILLLL